MSSKTKIFCFGLSCLLFLAVPGCVTTAEMYRGNSVSPEQVVVIQDRTPHKNSVADSDITIDYEFVRDGEILQLSGNAVLAERYHQSDTRLRYMSLFLFFVDDNSRVLETISLADALTNSSNERLEFSRSLKVPAEAVGISFGYNGEVAEGAEDSMFTISIYRLPLK